VSSVLRSSRERDLRDLPQQPCKNQQFIFVAGKGLGPASASESHITIFQVPMRSRFSRDSGPSLNDFSVSNEFPIQSIQYVHLICTCP
jgi:hypothetical protein